MNRTTGIEMYIVTAVHYGFLLVFFFVCFLLLLMWVRHCRDTRRVSRARQRAVQAGGSRVETPAQRTASIENWLVSKPVLPHDDVCDFANSLSTEEEEQDGGRGECSICFDEFQPKDIVSWSPNPKCCKRVFHHGCLKEWLLHKHDCPWCRETVLPVDGYSLPKTQRKQIHDLLIARQQRTLPCFYCIDHRIVHALPAGRLPTKPETLCAELRRRQAFLYGRSVLTDHHVVLDSDGDVSKANQTDEEMGGTVHDLESNASTEDAVDTQDDSGALFDSTDEHELVVRSEDEP